MTLIDDYLSDQKKYEEKYGQHTIVLMQVGHFYECYGIDNEIEQINGHHLAKLADVLNIQLTRKNKSIKENSRKNPLMIGVNIFSIDKYIQLLLNNDYTIIMVEQVGESPYIERKITNIYSPGTNIEYNSKGDTNNLMCIYFENSKPANFQKSIMCVGMSVIDLSTGKNIVFETYSNINDGNYALDELFRCIQTYEPKEILIVKKNIEMDNTNLFNYLDLSQRIVHIIDLDSTQDYYDNKEKLDISYQNTLLSKVFRNTGMLSVIEYLDFETRNFARLSYIFLLSFAYDHNSTIIEKINKPEYWEESSYLNLTNNSINQLNVVSSSSMNINTKFNSLFAVIDNTSTPIGKRFLRERLLNPVIDDKELNNRYSYVESFLAIEKNENPRYLFQQYEEHLNKIVDIEKLHRKLGLMILQPCDFSSLDFSYQHINDILNIENNIINTIKPSHEHIQQFKEFVLEYSGDFNMDEIIKFHLDKINSSFFNRDVYSEIDFEQDCIEEYRWIFNEISKKLSFIIDSTQGGFVKLEFNERDGYYLSATSKRCSVLKKEISRMKNSKIKIKKTNVSGFYEYELNDIEFKTTKSNTKLFSNSLISISNKLRKSEETIGLLCRKKFIDKLSCYHSKYGECLSAITNFIAYVDLLKSCAKTSKMYGYTRPVIEKKENGCSFIRAKQLRHPIIERINIDINYVPNDIELGVGMNGMLLFGTNASGKSSLMKAIGLNVIMAQAGFFVSSEQMTFSPYKNLFTRIQNNDNIFKGESSYAVEMGELRGILKRGDRNSLILGDELCSGTESISALSIFSSSVIKLEEKGCHFVFATHLHELCKINRISQLEKVKMYHLKVIFNKETGELVYDRKLEDGSGPAIYGLEVCKAMDMDRDFLLLAEEIRKEVLDISPKIVENNKSHYNSKVYIDNCGICGKKADDVHHIKFQCTADKDNIIDKFLEKDAKSNLVPLCKECHNNVHSNKIEISGWKQTSNGFILDYRQNSEKQRENKGKGKAKKIPENIVEIIKTLKKENQKLTQKSIKQHVEGKHNINISISIIGKIINNKY